MNLLHRYRHRTALVEAGKRGRERARLVATLANARARATPWMPIVRWLLRAEIPVSERERTGKAPNFDNVKIGDQPARQHAGDFNMASSHPSAGGGCGVRGRSLRATAEASAARSAKQPAPAPRPCASRRHRADRSPRSARASCAASAAASISGAAVRHCCRYASGSASCP
jgi:hypothetical protein